jgi:hypothetical protein
MYERQQQVSGKKECGSGRGKSEETGKRIETQVVYY